MTWPRRGARVVCGGTCLACSIVSSSVIRSTLRTTAPRLSFAPRPMGAWGARAPAPLSEDDERGPTSCSGFYSRAFVSLPPVDGRLVAFRSTSLGPRAPPAVGGQRLPDKAGVIPNPELLTEQLDHPSEGPAIHGGASPARPPHQHAQQRPLLRLGQLERLAPPAAGGQHLPDMAGVIPNPEPPLD